MIKNFPEIELFFKKKEFTEIQIKKLKRKIKIKYSDSATIMKAFDLIESKLLLLAKQRINEKSENNLRIRVRPKNGFAHVPAKIHFEKNTIRIDAIKFKRISNTQESINILKTGCSAFYNKRLFSVSNQLQISTSRIIDELKIKGFIVKESNLLRSYHINAIEEFLTDYIMNPDKIKTPPSKKTKGARVKGRAKRAPVGAWGKLHVYGMRGKLIYTR